MKPNNNLTEEEREIEHNIEKFTSIAGEKRTQIENILETTRKNRAISLRISNFDLERIKEKAEQGGIPYQTLITSVLHKYIMNQFYEKDEIIKAIRLLREKKAI